jgi:hypothetical protein
MMHEAGFAGHDGAEHEGAEERMNANPVRGQAADGKEWGRNNFPKWSLADK